MSKFAEEMRRQFPVGHSDFNVVFPMVRRHFPELAAGAITAALRECGLYDQPVNPGYCGYRGSLGPQDYEQLESLIQSVEDAMQEGGE